MDYKKFLKDKMELVPESGLQIDNSEINEMLFPHQKDAVRWAISGGCRAIFASFGLGKTFIQLEILRIILKYEGGKALMIAPLGVRQEFKRDAVKLGIKIEYIKTNDDVKGDGIYITNYERVRDCKLDVSVFTAVSLDEASVLRGYGTKTYQNFLTLFPETKYKFVATATPSPNRYKELIHYAGFLGVMDTGQALTRFFQRDSQKANHLTLYPHKEEEFWLWMSSWALFINKPSDLGYSDTGYELPEMKIHYHCVKVNHNVINQDRDGQLRVFRSAAIGLKEAAYEKRHTLKDRIEKMAEIVKENPDSSFLLWHHLERERHEIKKAIKGTIDIYGSQDLELREKRVIDFSDGNIKYFATKPELSGSGCNFQNHCNNAIFLGINYEFNDFIQAVHRIYRFLQNKEVNIHIIYAESEHEILKVLQKKWTNHNKMVNKMIDIIKEYGLAKNSIENALRRKIITDRNIREGKYYTAINSDCINETKKMKDNSVDLIVTSIPFSNHYEYTPSYNDFGHTKNDKHFFEQMDFLTPQLLRILKPGRIAGIHVKDRINFGNVTGYGTPTVNPFHMMTTFHFLKHGFIFLGMITIETDVVRENNQTYRLGWTEQTKDGTKMGVGSPEYILLFRKLSTDTTTAYADNPVVKTKKDYSRGKWQIDARSKWNSSGDRFLSPTELRQYNVEQITRYYSGFIQDKIYNYDVHVKIATDLEKLGKLPGTFETLKVPARYESVWSDVVRMRTLNSDQSRRKLQQHICPLQFDIVNRLIIRYSNEGETIFDPFAGIMTVPFRAVKLNRYGIGVELNYDYYRDGCGYLLAAEEERKAPTLFEVENIAV